MAIIPIVISIYCVYAIGMTIFLTRLLRNYSLKVLSDPDKIAKFAGFYFPPLKTNEYIEFFLGALIFFPIKIISTIICLIILFIILKLAAIGHDLKKPMPWLRKIIIKKTVQFFVRIGLFFCGVYWISLKHEKIKTYDPSYPEERYKDRIGKTKIPIVISNHTSFLDVLYYNSSDIFPSFLTKIEVKKYPFIGTFCTLMQSLYFDRKTKESREMARKLISERVKIILEGKDMPILHIHPEGIF